MTTQLRYRNHVAEAFGMREAPVLLTRALRKSTMAVTELEFGERNFGMTAPIPLEDAYLIGLQLLPCLDHDLYFEGRFVKPTNWFAGAITIYDLRRSPIADIRDPYHCLMFHLPRKAMDTMAYEAGARRIGELKDCAGLGMDDSTARSLLSSLLPAIARPSEAPALFLDHVAMALTAHVGYAYGGMGKGAEAQCGGLAPHLVRRAQDLMTASLKDDISLGRLAEECGLSRRHFTRAFRRSTGLSPHRWLMQYRVERAGMLLAEHRGFSLAEVALVCGFADQSHFTRVFTAMVGVSPGAWCRSGGKPGNLIQRGHSLS